MYKFINKYDLEKTIQVIEREFKGISVNENGMCAYRGQDGKKCAVGIFLSDLFCRRNRIEGLSYEDLSSLHPGVTRRMPLDKKGMQSFQLHHDNLPDRDSSVEEQKKSLIKWLKANTSTPDSLELRARKGIK